MLGLGFRVLSFGSRVLGLGASVLGSGSRVFWVWGLGLRDWSVNRGDG